MERSLFRINLLKAQIVAGGVEVVEGRARPLLIFLSIYAPETVHIFAEFLELFLELAPGLAGADMVAFCRRCGRSSIQPALLG